MKKNVAREKADNLVLTRFGNYRILLGRIPIHMTTINHQTTRRSQRVSA